LSLPQYLQPEVAITDAKCEKPMALNAQEAEDMIREAENLMFSIMLTTTIGAALPFRWRSKS
jgi:hypothetical protein